MVLKDTNFWVREIKAVLIYDFAIQAILIYKNLYFISRAVFKGLIDRSSAIELSTVFIVLG